jgi:NADPH-dependent 2,4-dienoyl-CoA reductase/sulfur reductase-like enzyme
MSTYYRNRLLLLTATVVACAILVSVGHWSRVPFYPAHDPSLWAMPASAGRMLVVLAALVGATAIATLIAGGVRVEAGLFAAAVGLAALSAEGGPMRYARSG